MLPDKVLGQPRRHRRAARLDPDDDVLVSWLPLYHDMGLVGLLTLPMSTGTALVLGAPQDFTSRPARWMEWLSDLRRHGHRRPQLQLRAGHPGPQPGRAVRPVAAAHRPQRGRADRPRPGRGVRGGRRPPRLRPGAVFPAFGMAEVAIAGTFPSRAPAWSPTASTAGCWRPSATRPRSSRGPTAAAGWRCSAGPCPAWRSASSTPTPALRCRTGRSASSRSAARP